VPIDRTLLRRADLPNSVALELASRNRLLPPRWDYAALAVESAAVETWLRSQLRRGPPEEARASCSRTRVGGARGRCTS